MLLFALLSAVLPVSKTSEYIKGIHFSVASLYVPGKQFTCLDGSATIDWLKVNDDYCDCRDGTDEPGTAACPNSKFFCRNIGHVGEYIPSSRVNDMICDCCDGSDEYSDRHKCNDTCSALAHEAEASLLEKRREFELGHELYKEYVSKAIQIENEAKIKEAEEQALRDAETHQPTDAVKSTESSEHLHSSTLETDTSEDEVKDTLTHPQVSNSAVMDDEEGSKEKYEDSDQENQAEENETEMQEKLKENIAPPPQPSVPIDYGPERAFLMLSPSYHGCLHLEESDYTYSLCAFQRAEQRMRGSDSSSGTLLGVWRGWLDHPEDSENWSREEKLKLPYAIMLYEDGLSCWNGPSRSVKVHVQCGPENKLISASEPSRCTYAFSLQTPAACHHHPDELIARIHTEL